ncbi:MAG: hypothetical protein IJ125_05535 [Atopobiaceae bacterium]|nr:hypothetical protein [Atopobiaceae bacterium]
MSSNTKVSQPTLQQVNVRLDAGLKARAEEVLGLMGSSATELIRTAYEKVARGAADYTEAMSVLKTSGSQTAKIPSALEEGWAIADSFFDAHGIDKKQLPDSVVSWDELYEQALSEHFREKGLLP